MKYRWHVTRGHNTFYAGRRVTIANDRKRPCIKMHWEIIKVPEGMFVDHINHNGLDNRKANLRLATRAQNSWNKRNFKAIGCTSRFKGVFKCGKRWQVKIQVNKTRKTIGYFDSEIEAARAYDAAARKFHKEFAVLNLPSNKK